MLENIYTELIAEHSQSRENRRTLEHATIKERGHNPSCGDEITLELEIVDGVISAGHHCARSLMKYLGQNATCRASFYFYNTRRDVERLIEAVQTVRRTMRLA